MADRSPDARLIRTRAALVDAITELLDERPVSEITISDLVRRAQVTRPTFYQHFSDIAAVARAALIERLQSSFPPQHLIREWEELDPTSWELEQTITGILSHIVHHSLFYRRVLHGAGSFPLYEDLCDFIEAELMTRSPIRHKIREAALSGRIDPAFIAGGFVTLVVRWLKTDFTGPNAVDVFAPRLAKNMHLIFQSAIAPRS
jgi:AcrR family transcriptional regulator